MVLTTCAATSAAATVAAGAGSIEDGDDDDFDGGVSRSDSQHQLLLHANYTSLTEPNVLILSQVRAQTCVLKRYNIYRALQILSK